MIFLVVSSLHPDRVPEKSTVKMKTGNRLEGDRLLANTFDDHALRLNRYCSISSGKAERPC